jgi:hypothetical protein
MLVGFDCDEAQGYYYSHPIPPEKIAQLFKESLRAIDCNCMALDLSAIRNNSIGKTRLPQAALQRT